MTSWDETDLDDMGVWYEWKIRHGKKNHEPWCSG